jgi:hypothetical protein
MEFRGIRSTFEFSEISGDLRTVYSHEPVNIVAPYFEEVIAIDSVKIPKYYFIPQAWTKVIDVLKAHEVRMWTLGSSVTGTIESYKFSDVRWQERPFEGRHPVKFKSEAFSEVRTFPAGTFVVPTAQRTGKVLMNLLEPNGPDSFVGWGFFDGIFEQKEYGEHYVLEKLARDMLAKDPALKKEFEAKIAADSAFAKSPNARLNFFYQRSPYWDTAIGVYPVARVMGNAFKNEELRTKNQELKTDNKGRIDEKCHFSFSCFCNSSNYLLGGDVAAQMAKNGVQSRSRIAHQRRFLPEHDSRMGGERRRTN